MDRIRFSVIVPVYNAEKTLPRCVDSILLPDRHDLEIILVDDGSADGSAELCRDYAARCAQVVFLKKPNGGVSSARNMGLDNARGERIMFADSDDCYLPGWLDKIEQTVMETNADLIEYSWIVKSADAERVVQTPNVDIISETERAASLAAEIRGMRLNAPVAKVFRKSIIDAYHLRFPEDLAIGEDLVFVFSFALYAERVSIRSDVLYCAYAENADSLSRKRRDGLLDKLLLADEKMMVRLNMHEMSPESRLIYHNALTWSYYRKAYTASKELLKYDDPAAQRMKKIKTICRQFDASRSRNCDWKTKIMSAPVRWKMAHAIDFMVRRQAAKR